MKSNVKIILLFAVFVILMFVIQTRMPVAFKWEPTFRHNDGEPFGCMVFDSVMTKSLPKGYKITQHSLSSIAQEMDSTGKVRNVLVVGQEIPLSENDNKAMKSIMKKGGKVMLVMSTSYDNKNMTDSLLGADYNMGTYTKGYFTVSGFIRNLEGNGYMNDTVYWHDGTGNYPQSVYRFYKGLIDSGLFVWDSVKVKTVASKAFDEKETRGFVCTRKYGKGQIILCAAPLLCTNYGVLSNDTRGLVFRMMSLVSDREVVRTEVYCKGILDENTNEEKTLLGLITSNKPLLWAWRLMGITLIVFMIFNARRRQKVIPVIERPRNHSLEFVKLIGTLFYHNHNHVDLVCKKFALFKEDILKKTGIDLGDETIDLEDSIQLLSHRTGMKSGDIRSVIVRTLQVVNSKDVAIEAEKMISLIDGMNDIQKLL